MRLKTISVASGKGGTGKTTVALGLASTMTGLVTLVDCDVEEPNVHLFLDPRWEKEEVVTVAVPSTTGVKCSNCKKCTEHCRFNAIAILGNEPMVYPELCHSCGACVRVCPNGVLTETQRRIGVMREGSVKNLWLCQGMMDIGEAKSAPLIDYIKKRGAGLAACGSTVVIDCPPGTSCPVMAAVRGSDFLVLVTEPTPFGLNDLNLAVEMARALSIPFGVVLNRAGMGNSDVTDFCQTREIPLLAEIPYDSEVAKEYSRGALVTETLPSYQRLYQQLWSRIGEVAGL